MSDQDIKQVSALTGTFASLQPTPEKAAAGNASPDSGRKLPLPDEPDVERLAKEQNVAVQSIGRELRFRVDMEKRTLRYPGPGQ